MLGVTLFEVDVSSFALTFGDRAAISPDRIVALVSQPKGRYRISPDGKLTRDLTARESTDLVRSVGGVVAEIEAIAE